MTRAQVWWALLVVGQGVTIALGWLAARKVLHAAEKLSVMLALILSQVNDAVVELQRHRGILAFKKPDPPDDPDPPLWIGS